MSEQADALASGELEDLASFLEDNPKREPSLEDDEDNNAEESNVKDDNDGSEDDQQDSDSDEDEAEAKSDDEDKQPTTDQKITIKVKAEDGTDETLELTPDEISASYMRQRDYTIKTQKLSERESQAVEFLKSKHDEFRQQYLSQAELARAAVINVAGIKTEAELAQLANSDPAAWVAESQRQKEISHYLNQLDQQINGERQRAAQEQTERQAQTLQEQYQKAWTVLAKEKIDKPTLTKIYDDAKKVYGFTDEELGGVYDSRLVMALRDAAAYQALKSQKAEVTKKVVDAPRLPNKQSTPANERRQQKLNDRFKGGRAKLSDLAELLR